MAPIGQLSTLLVSQTNQYGACQGDTFMKQLKTRFSTFSGAFNVLFTVVYSVVMGTWAKNNNSLYTAFAGVINNQSCYLKGYSLGQVAQGILSVQVADNVY
jgi:hypothetical protein